MEEEKKEKVEEKPEETSKPKESPKEEEQSKEQLKEDEDQGPSLTDKIRENPWVMATMVLGIVTLILLIGDFSGSMTGGAIGVANQDDVEAKILNFVSSQVDGEVELVETNFKNGLYEIIILFDGREVPIYVTADGENLVQGVTPLDQLIQAQQQQSQQNQLQQTNQGEELIGYSEDDLREITTFSQCLEEKGMKIYGAGWCGYCQQLIEYFGGKEAIAPIFIECSDAERNPTENAELCDQEGIQGFPTIKVNGEIYQGPRTFEGFSEITGCSLPKISL